MEPDARRIRPFTVIGPLVVWTLLLVVAPFAMLAISRLRFDEANPLLGIASSPSAASFVAWITNGSGPVRLDGLIIDVIVALALGAAWIVLGVVVTSVALEVLLRIRHGGGEGPARRGPRWSQRLVGYLAAGLVALISQTGSVRAVEIPVVTSATAVSSMVTPETAAVPWVLEQSPTAGESGAVRSPDSEQVWALHRVVAGESVLSIAQDYAQGREPLSVAYLILEANLGSTMPDGSIFTSPAVIEPGWELSVPVAATPASSGGAGQGAGHSDGIARIHIVESGDTLWDLAGRYLGDSERWPEIFHANAGRTFDDGRRLDDPDLILPGWDLTVGTASPTVERDEMRTGSETEPSAHEAAATVDPEQSADHEFDEVADGAAAGVADGAADGVADGAVDELADGAADARQSTSMSSRGADEDDGVEVSAAEAVPFESAGTGVTHQDASGRVETGSAEGSLDRLGFQLAGAGGAIMLTAALVAAFAGRRRRQLRAAQERLALMSGDPDDLERAARAMASASLARSVSSPISRVDRQFDDSEIPLLSGDELMVRFDLVLRALARAVSPSGAGAVMAVVGSDGGVAVRLDRHVDGVTDWSVDGLWWTLPASVQLEHLVELAEGVDVPSVAMVQLGRDSDGASVFIDLEAAGVLSVVSDADARSDAVIAALAVCLSGSEFSEGVTIVTVGLDAAIGLSRRSSSTADSIRAAIADTTWRPRETLATASFSLRARATGGERWEPLVVFAGSRGAGEDDFANRSAQVPLPAGVAVVVAGPHPTHRLMLRDIGNRWELGGPLLDGESRLIEPNLIHDEGIAALRERFGGGLAERSSDSLKDSPGGPGDGEPEAAADDEFNDERSGLEEAITPRALVEPQAFRVSEASIEAVPEGAAASWHFMVRLFGPVDVVTADGETVTFERSRSIELLAWLVTHRHHATRLGARTAMWEVDVRNSTFSNVVSDVRRGLARAAGGSQQDWIAYGTGDDLVLHESVCSDAEILDAALQAVGDRSGDDVIEELRPAVELVRTLPFSTTSYLWPDSEGITTMLIMLAVSASARLAEAYLELGDDTGVYRATEAGLAVIPGHEDLIALRLRAHGRSGDHAGLRSEWDAYRRALERDPWADSEPSWRLVELRNELLGTDPS